jgi:hypothetical protein
LLPSCGIVCARVQRAFVDVDHAASGERHGEVPLGRTSAVNLLDVSAVAELRELRGCGVVVEFLMLLVKVSLKIGKSCARSCSKHRESCAPRRRSQRRILAKAMSLRSAVGPREPF